MRYAKQHNNSAVNIFQRTLQNETAIYRIHDDETWEQYIPSSGRWCCGIMKFIWSNKKDSWLCGGKNNFYNYEISEEEAFIEIL